MFDRMLGYANHLGLFAEQTSRSGEALGNFPQAFTHLALIDRGFQSRSCTGRQSAMSSPINISTEEIADRLTIRELFDAYAHCADTRDAEGQKALFSADTRFAVFMGGPGTDPSYVLEGREALSPVFDDLNRYEVTMHFNGQSTVTLDGDSATGDSYTIAHHVFTEDGTRQMMVAWLRYLDVFTRIDDAWLIAEREIILQWSETRALGALASER